MGGQKAAPLQICALPLLDDVDAGVTIRHHQSDSAAQRQIGEINPVAPMIGRKLQRVHRQLRKAVGFIGDDVPKGDAVHDQCVKVESVQLVAAQNCNITAGVGASPVCKTIGCCF